MKKVAIILPSLVALSIQVANAEVYLGGKLGNTWADDACYASSPCDDDSFGGGIYAGYDFTDMIALEAGYDRLGSLESNFNDNGTSVVIDDTFSAFTLAPKLTLPMDSLDIFAKLGAAKVDYGSADDLVLMGALGAEYAFSKNLLGRLEYQRINNIQDDFVEGMDLDSVFLGLTYKFGSKAKPAPVIEPKVEPAPEPAPVVEEQAPVVEKPKPEIKRFQEFGTELFDNDSYKLAQGSEQYFDWIVGVMDKYPQAEVEIIGHTDSVGSEAYNQKLSENRAQAVADYLYTQGVEASRVTVKGMGESQPKATNDTPEGRMANRRVEVIINEFEYQE
ncbi:OmpA family protein [Vibrio sp. JC009]|uniref:OmpA family protein n=1 Tax=Vibrio sp. JC009 TaxID=2912314 RepID=UPI0023AEFFCC|nr:OmpA family protein [Vibrio sp. JC009]WED22183.1 OmpA family protein [Vibrio sp. JC009]